MPNSGKLRLALIEGAHHSEVVSLLALMASTQEFEIHLYTHTALKPFLFPEVLSNQNLVFHFAPENTRFLPWIQGKISELKTFDKVILTSLDTKDGDYVNLSEIPGVYLYLHALHHDFVVFGNRIRGLLRLAKSIWEGRSYFKRRQTLLAYQNYLVASDQIAESLSNLLDDDRSKIRVIPFYCIGPPNTIPERRGIVIPGSVNEEIRNYDMVLDCLQRLDRQVDVYLLGKLKNKNLKKRVDALNKAQSGISVHYFETPVPSDVYESSLVTCKFAILPLKPRFEHGSGFEIAGKTTLSGSFNDVCRKTLPFLYPSDICLPEDLADLGEAYQSKEDLLRIIKKWLVSDQNELGKKFDQKRDQLNLYKAGENLKRQLMNG